MKGIGACFAMAAVAAGLSAEAAMAENAVLPRAAIEDGFRKADCTVELEAAANDPQSFDLGAGKTLFLISCWRAAYQSGSIALVADGAGVPRLQIFQSWDGKRFVPFQSLSEADYDPDKKTLSSYHKGRGIGDCGSVGEWTWTGREFKLAKYFYKEKCDGRDFSGGKRWQIFPPR